MRHAHCVALCEKTPYLTLSSNHLSYCIVIFSLSFSIAAHFLTAMKKFDPTTGTFPPATIATTTAIASASNTIDTTAIASTTNNIDIASTSASTITIMTAIRITSEEAGEGAEIHQNQNQQRQHQHQQQYQRQQQQQKPQQKSQQKQQQKQKAEETDMAVTTAKPDYTTSITNNANKIQMIVSQEEGEEMGATKADHVRADSPPCLPLFTSKVVFAENEIKNGKVIGNGDENESSEMDDAFVGAMPTSDSNHASVRAINTVPAQNHTPAPTMVGDCNNTIPVSDSNCAPVTVSALNPAPVSALNPRHMARMDMVFDQVKCAILDCLLLCVLCFYCIHYSHGP
jgi:hypothetical protein